MRIKKHSTKWLASVLQKYRGRKRQRKTRQCPRLQEAWETGQLTACGLLDGRRTLVGQLARRWIKCIAWLIGLQQREFLGFDHEGKQSDECAGATCTIWATFFPSLKLFQNNKSKINGEGEACSVSPPHITTDPEELFLEYLFFLFPSPQACEPLQGLPNSLWDPWGAGTLFRSIPTSSIHFLHYGEHCLEVEKKL